MMGSGSAQFKKRDAQDGHAQHGGEAQRVQVFWDFALARYARAGVAPCCLALQDEFGANVLLLLYICWRAAAGETVEGARLDEALRRTEPFDRHLVRPLRAARRTLRAASRALPSPALAAAAERLAARELAAEQAEAAALAEDATVQQEAAAARTHAARSVAAYLAARGVAPVRAFAAAEQLAGLVFAAP
jgi:uncharacterized protein (TIGR02444 family)